MIDTIDIIRSKLFVLDAQVRADGYIEAVHLNSKDIEEVLLFSSETTDKGEPVLMETFTNPKDENIEMYRWSAHLQTFFHSKQTLHKFKKNRKNDQDEPILPQSN